MIDTAAIPGQPGCYLFHDERGTIIYIGKAKDLKKRVSSYFSREIRDAKTEALVRDAASLDFIVTDTEVEALILENTLIKRHQPKYNIDLRDSKNYAYIHITDGPYPAIGIARKATGKGTFFGPFVSARERDYVLSVVKKTFGLRSCRRLPKRACLRHHMGSCAAPCIGCVTPEEYAELVRRASSVLKGSTGGLLAQLRDEMARLSAMEEFEQAMAVRDQITAVEHLARRQHVARQKRSDEDVIGALASGGMVYLILFHVERGMLAEKEEYIFPEHPGYLEEFVVQYYGQNTPPAELIVPRALDEAVVEYLGEQRGSNVAVTVPQRGAKRRLLELAGKNIELCFFGDRLKTEALARAIGLPEPPEVIECFDISHLSGSETVGSMVQFVAGRPEKRGYRRFRIRSVEGVDDFAAIAEVVGRRYARLKREEAPMPDLIVVDGGPGQLAAASRALGELGLAIPVIALAKREEEVYVPGMRHPLPVPRTGKASLFLQEIRDEAHRFALAYHRLLRRKRVVS